MAGSFRRNFYNFRFYRCYPSLYPGLVKLLLLSLSISLPALCRLCAIWSRSLSICPKNLAGIGFMRLVPAFGLGGIMHPVKSAPALACSDRTALTILIIVRFLYVSTLSSLYRHILFNPSHLTDLMMHIALSSASDKSWHYLSARKSARDWCSVRH